MLLSRAVIYLKNHSDCVRVPTSLEIMENQEKVPCMETSWNLKKTNNHGKIMEFCDII